MPVPRKSAPTPRIKGKQTTNNSCDYDTLRKTIVEAVKEKYKVNLTDFSKGKLPKKLGIPSGAILRSYLSGCSVSFPVMEKLATDVGITIKKKTVVTRVTHYTLIKN